MDKKQKAFLQLMKSAFWYAERAYDCSFDNPDEKRTVDKCSAMAYAAACSAKVSAAEALYYAEPELAHGELPDLFSMFEIFIHELFKDFETDHSKQWVDIEFNRLKDAFDDSVCKQDIPE